MMVSPEAKELSTLLRRKSTTIFNAVSQAYELSIPGCSNERNFLARFVSALSAQCSAISIPGASFGMRVSQIHAKPIVTAPTGRCELGDLLIVAKYHLLDFSVEWKAVIYQVKLADAGTAKCRISRKQLRLLRDWPPFSFGSKLDGTRQNHHVRPLTTEFGSYMLEPRNAAKGEYIDEWALDLPLSLANSSLRWKRTYGLCPNAWQCQMDGPCRVDIRKLPHVLPDADAITSQILFLIGEHNSNTGIAQFLKGLYRYVGLDPDPPDEFRGDSQEDEEDGFAVVEINVKQRPEEQSE